MKKLFITALIVCLYSDNTFALKSEYITKDSNNVQLIHIMDLSKIVGFCGVINQMIQFQETTRMPGGDDFVNRFIKTEITRLNINREQYKIMCEKSLNAFGYYRTLNKFVNKDE